MKRIKYKALFIIIVQVLMIVESCSPHSKDTTIKADLATKAKSEKDFAGVRFMVENGIVTLDGECPSEKSKSTVESTTKGLYGVKGVINNITVGPVVIGTDYLLKQGVDSILKQYASVEATTKDSIVYLNGRIESDQRQKLEDAINQLKPKMVQKKLTIK